MTMMIPRAMVRTAAIASTSLLLAAICATTAWPQGPVSADPEEVRDDFDFNVQGEYVGTVATDEGQVRVAVQVIALGNGRFQAVAYSGGLPGDGWDRQLRLEVDGRRAGDEVEFAGEHGSGAIVDGVLVTRDDAGEPTGQLRKVERRSPTLGKEPPQGAVVLFDGSSAEQWQNGRLTDDGLLQQGTTSRATFGDHSIHIEFRLPFEPEARGQARGNSGIYVQGRYEIQMLDSFGLEGRHDECGGIYSVRAPSVNMCLPPLSWQTYDIDYVAARYDDQGELVSPPRMTVRHNGVLIHDNVTLPGERSTTAAPLGPGAQPGPIYLQDHGSPVRYRNIWVVEKPSQEP